MSVAQIRCVYDDNFDCYSIKKQLVNDYYNGSWQILSFKNLQIHTLSALLVNPNVLLPKENDGPVIELYLPYQENKKTVACLLVLCKTFPEI